jgi:phage pi2 protein 07
MDAFGSKQFPQLQYTKILHSCPKHKFCIFLHAEGFLNAPKDNQTSFSVPRCRMDAFGAKPFSQHRYTEIVHWGPKHKFCIFLHIEGFLTGLKDNQTSFSDQWSRMDAFGSKQFPQLLYTKILHSCPKHKFCIFLHAEGFLNVPKDNQTSFSVPRCRMDAFGANPFSQHRCTEIVHWGPKHKFCIFLHTEGFLTALKDNQTSFSDQWSRMDAYGY